MSKISLIVEYQVKPGLLPAFLDTMRRHARACLDEEPGCLRFELLRPLDETGSPQADVVMANELFEDMQALAFHRATPRWQALNETFKAMLDKRTPRLGSLEDD